MNRRKAHPLVSIAFAGGVVACGTSSSGASNGLSSSPTADAPGSASSAPDAPAVTPQTPTPSIPPGSATASASSAGPGAGGGGQGPTGDGGGMAAGGAQPAAGGETASPGGAGTGGSGNEGAAGDGGGAGADDAADAGSGGAAGAAGGAPVAEVFAASFLEVAALIEARCGSQCHAGREGQEHLANFSTLELGAFYERVTAPLTTDLCYGESPVVPGAPESSLLLQVISGPSETPCVLPRMPAGCEQDDSCLAGDEVALVEAWIAAGAPRN